MLKSKVIQLVLISFLVFQSFMSNNTLAVPTSAIFTFGLSPGQSVNYNVTYFDPSFDNSTASINPNDSWNLQIQNDLSAVSGFFDESGVDLINVTDTTLFRWTNGTGDVMYGYNNVQGILYPIKTSLANGTTLAFTDILNLEFPGYPITISGSQASVDISGFIYLVFDMNTGILLSETIYDANSYKVVISGSLYPQQAVLNYGVSLGDHYALRAVWVDPAFDMTNYSPFSTGDAWVLDVVGTPTNVQGQLDYNGGEYITNTDPGVFFNTTYLSGSINPDDAGLLTPTIVVFQNGTTIGIEKTIKLMYPLLTNLVVGANDLSFDMDTGSYLFNVVVDKNLGIVSSYTMTDSLALQAHFQLDPAPQAIQLNYGVTTGDNFTFNATRLDPGFDMTGMDIFNQFDQWQLNVLAVPAAVEGIYHSSPDFLEFTDVNTYFGLTYPNATTLNSLQAIDGWILPTYGLLVNNSALGIVDFANLLGTSVTIYTTPDSLYAYYNMNNHYVFADYNLTNGVLQVLNITDATGLVATITLVQNTQDTTSPPSNNTTPTDNPTTPPPGTTSTTSTTTVDVSTHSTTTSEDNSPPEQNNSSSQPALPLPIGFTPILIGIITAVIFVRRRSKY